MKQPSFADARYVGKRKQAYYECFPLETDQVELGVYFGRNYVPHHVRRLPETPGLWVRPPTHGRRSLICQQNRQFEKVKVPVWTGQVSVRPIKYAFIHVKVQSQMRLSALLNPSMVRKHRWT